MTRIPTIEKMLTDLKSKTHQFIVTIKTHDTASNDAANDFWCKLCGENSVIKIKSTRQLPKVISAIIGLTEGTLDVADLENHLGDIANHNLIAQLSSIDIGAQAKLRHALPHPVPKAGDVFAKKNDVWPIQPNDTSESDTPTEAPNRIEYL